MLLEKAPRDHCIDKMLHLEFQQGPSKVFLVRPIPLPIQNSIGWSWGYEWKSFFCLTAFLWMVFKSDPPKNEKHVYNSRLSGDAYFHLPRYVNKQNFRCWDRSRHSETQSKTPSSNQGNGLVLDHIINRLGELIRNCNGIYLSL